MQKATDRSEADAPRCNGEHGEALNLYMDGELPFERQPELFAHLVVCDDCRRALDSVLTFRRFSRDEPLNVPPMVDDAFMKRLAAAKATNKAVNRYEDRRPLWQARKSVTVRSAIVAGVVVFIAGLLLPLWMGAQGTNAHVMSAEERVDFSESDRYFREAVYVFYPGLTVEAVKLEEGVDPGPL